MPPGRLRWVLPLAALAVVTAAIWWGVTRDGGSTRPVRPLRGTLGVTSVAGPDAFEVQLWDLAGPERLRSVEGALDPVFSPDGSHLAYWLDGGRPGTRGDRFVIEDDAGVATFPFGDRLVGELAWSPDGSRIAFAGTDPDLGPLVLVAGADGTHVEPVIRGAWSSVAWSPDGSLLALTGSPGPGEAPPDIYTVGLDGTDLRQLTHDEYQEFGVSWSPDGSMLAFQRNATLDDPFYALDVWTVGADGTGALPITSSPGIEISPVWSPDGRSIAFGSDAGAPEAIRQRNASGSEPLADVSVWVSSPDGTGARRVLEASEDEALVPASWRA